MGEATHRLRAMFGLHEFGERSGRGIADINVYEVRGVRAEELARSRQPRLRTGPAYRICTERNFIRACQIEQQALRFQTIAPDFRRILKILDGALVADQLESFD
jgi:hypothetical protein